MYTAPQKKLSARDEQETMDTIRLILKGALGAEKDRLLLEVRNAISRPESARPCPEWERSL